MDQITMDLEPGGERGIAHEPAKTPELPKELKFSLERWRSQGPEMAEAAAAFEKAWRAFQEQKERGDIAHGGGT